jgi:hypothetical protein
MFEAKKILNPHWFKTYKKDMDALALQLAELNTNLFILEKIVKFNFSLFGSGNSTFWVFVTYSLFESCIMCAWRMAIDTDGDCLTATQLKNSILKNIIDNEALKHLKNELKKGAFDKRIRKVSQRIQEIRHKRYAHLNKQIARAINSGGQVPHVSIRDLKMVRDTLNELIQIMGFETSYMFLPIDYDPSVRHPVGVDPRPDIVQILDDIAFKSEILSMPEKQPELWKHLRNKYSKAIINEFNAYRRKRNLPEV